MDRRKAIALMGGAGLGVLAACKSGSSKGGTTTATSGVGTEATEAACILTPEMTEGPYYIDVNMVRSDITEGRPGTPLTLNLTVVDAKNGCGPVKDAAVDIWHADASGEYSGFGGATTAGNPGEAGGAPPQGGAAGGPPPGGPGGGGGATPTNDKTFMRGVQMTDADGKATFKTVYPGWYTGRTPHIHVKVSTGGNEVHTGQLFFPDQVSSTVYDQGEYAGRGEPDTTNARDNIFSGGGDKSTLNLTRDGDAYVGTLTLGIQTA